MWSTNSFCEGLCYSLSLSSGALPSRWGGLWGHLRLQDRDNHPPQRHVNPRNATPRLPLCGGESCAPRRVPPSPASRRCSALPDPPGEAADGGVSPTGTVPGLSGGDEWPLSSPWSGDPWEQGQCPAPPRLVPCSPMPCSSCIAPSAPCF